MNNNNFEFLIFNYELDCFASLAMTKKKKLIKNLKLKIKNSNKEVCYE